MHKKKVDRKHLYHAYMNAYWPNHKEGDEPLSEAKFMPFPGDPDYVPPVPPRKEPSVDDCIEMMARNGEGGPGAEA